MIFFYKYMCNTLSVIPCGSDKKTILLHILRSVCCLYPFCGRRNDTVF